MHKLWQDIRFAFRQMVKTPGFSLTAILSLTLGIAATVSVFSVIYSAILNAWPYGGFDRVVQINAIENSGQEHGMGFTGPEVRQLRQVNAVEDVVAMQRWDLVVTGNDIPENLYAVYFTGNGFQFYAMPPLLGRYFDPSDAPDGKDPQPVAVLAYNFWRRHFNGDPSVVGKNIQLMHKDYTILGVLQPRFTWMDGDVYLPLKMSETRDVDYNVFLKLKPGVQLKAAEAELTPLMQHFKQEAPNAYMTQFTIVLRKMGDYYVRGLRNTLYLLFAAVAVLLAIGCGNLSILLLARGTARQHELAIRAAVGASRARIVRQLLTEALLLALIGAGLGIVLAYQLLGFIVARLPEYSFPHEADFHVNLPVLAFSVGLALVSGALFGVFPALDSARKEINRLVQAGSTRVAGSAGGRRMHTGLIAGQIALTLLLLSAAGAAVQGLSRMMDRPLGYDPHNVISIGIPIHENTLGTWAERAAYLRNLRDQVAAVPGVTFAGISTNATPPDNGWNQPVEIIGKTPNGQQEALANFISPEYLSLLHIPLVAGRSWEQSEVARGAMLAIVNQAFVQRYFPGEDALNHSIRLPLLTGRPPYQLDVAGSDGPIQIIGVAADALDAGLNKPIQPALYLPYSVNMWMGTQILVKSQRDPMSIVRPVREAIAKINPDQQVDSQIDNLDRWITREPVIANAQLVSILFAGFSVLALALAAVGLYSVVSYTVAQRTNELGIRVALGARRQDVLRIVIWSAGISVGIGLACGLALSFGLGRVIEQWVENGVRDPWTVLTVSLLVVFVAGAACLGPALRALAVDPMTALRRD